MFKFVLAAMTLTVTCFTSSLLHAQDAAASATEKGSVSSMISEAVAGYSQMKTIILASAEKMPAENFSFKPTPEIRSYGELLTHVAQSQNGLCGVVSGTPMGRPEAITATTKEELIAALKKSFDTCDAANSSVTEANAMMISGRGYMRGSKIGLIQKMVAHDNEMYGQMVVYMRLKGIVPPSTAMRGRM